jgi:septal ring factor EnvC (AmiA/AmiB activator)
LLFLPVFAFPQHVASKAKDRKQLELERSKAQKQIETTKKILRQTQDKKKQSVAVLRTLQTQIGLRKKIINQLGKELDGIENEIASQRSELIILNREIRQLKTQYASLIYNGYKSRNARNRLQFVFSADNFNQVIKRMNYLKKLVEYREKQLELIKRKLDENTERVGLLVETKNEKLMLISNRESERKDLETDEKTENELYGELRKQEKDLIKELREKEALARKLDDAIKKAIEEEIRKAREAELKRKKAEEIRKKKEDVEREKKNLPPKKEIPMVEIDKALSVKFNENISNLPWPVKTGFISQSFGRHQHPTMRNITTENNGVNINTTEGTNATAVFDGVVTAIVKIPGLFNTVLVKHGAYFTVYSNLEEVNVSKDQEVKVGHILGKIHTSEEGKTELHFEVWNGNVKQDPESWLRKKY